MTEGVHEANGTGAEAPASATVKVMLSGYEVLFTMRDQSAHALLTKRLPGALKTMSEMGATPAPAWSGKGGGKDTSERHVCPIHSVEMKRFERDGRSWFSHKAIAPDGSETWCKGKTEG